MLDVLCLLFLCLLVCVTWDICVCVGGGYCCYPFVVSVFSLIDMDGEYYILSCVVSVFSLIDTDGVYCI